MMPTMEPEAETKDETSPASTPLIVLFDGTCGMCDAAVNFILKHDTAKRFRFAAQQSRPGLDLLAQHGLGAEEMDSVVLIDGSHAYLRSSAVLRIASELPEPWAMAGLLAFLPASWRDAAYDFVARHRKQWFKPREECRMPTSEERERFLV
jgi:predicted DCC family thiol-disulfide oxidoreductase YuxK